MEFCRQCGKQLAGTESFCVSCGAATARTAASSAPQTAAPTPWQAAKTLPALPQAKSLRGLGTALQWLFGAAAVIFAVSAAVALSSWSAVSDIDSGRISGIDALIKAENVESSLSASVAVLVFLGIPIFVLLIIWSHRGYTNLRSFGVTNYRLSTGMAIGAWFIPFYNWFAPKQVINDMWRGSEPGHPIDPVWTKRKILPISTVWWIGYPVFMSIAAVGYGMVTGDAEVDPFLGAKILRDPAEAATGLVVAAVGLLGLTAIAILGAMTVRQTSARQSARTRELAQPQTPPAEPHKRPAEPNTATEDGEAESLSEPAESVPESAAAADFPEIAQPETSRPLERKKRRDGF
jgi:Domain of unknown function (DUF4328)